MDDLELGGGGGGKMRKTHDMRSELNLSTSAQQFVGFGMLPDQVYNKAVRKGFEFSLMVVGRWTILYLHTLTSNPLTKRVFVKIFICQP